MAFTTPIAADFYADEQYPEFAPRPKSPLQESTVQSELDRAGREVNQMLFMDETEWQAAVMLLTAHELTLRRGGGTLGGRGSGAVTSRSNGSVSASFGDPGVPEPFGSTNYGVTYYRRFVARYGVLRFAT